MGPRASPRAGLTDSQLHRLKALLEQKRKDLRARTSSTLGRVGGEHEALADPADRASEAQEDAGELGIAEPDHRILEQIERALAKLENGSYGVSELSGEPIGFPRLEALPWATRSADEQEAREPRRPREQ